MFLRTRRTDEIMQMRRINRLKAQFVQRCAFLAGLAAFIALFVKYHP